MALFRETADVSVRPAVAGDESAVTDVQVASWRATGVLGEGVLEALDVPAMRERWASAITSPPGPGFAVLVALAHRGDVELLEHPLAQHARGAPRGDLDVGHRRLVTGDGGADGHIGGLAKKGHAQP